LAPFGIVALKPAEMSGVTIMKMISSTSITSIIGTTFGSDLTCDCPAVPTDMPMVVCLSVRVKTIRAFSR
jgi:hypothetical protein